MQKKYHVLVEIYSTRLKKIAHLNRFISTHFGTVSPLSMLSINQSLFLQKTKTLYPNTQIIFWDWDLNLGHKELGI